MFPTTFDLIEEVGGQDRMREMMRTFYDRLFDDAIVGFLFQGHDKAHLVETQIQYLTANLGDRSGTYSGKPIRKAHAHLPILAGHFDRRHHLLELLLAEYDVPDHVRQAWLELDASLRPLVLNVGAAERDRILSPTEEA